MRIWITTLILVAAGLGATEAFWRSQGHRPSVVDDPDLWAYHRARVYGNSVVLLGASRIQVGFDTDLFRSEFPNYRLVQLAFAGEHPLATLRDLAGDENFHGVVICAIVPVGFLEELRDDQQEFVDYYHRGMTLNSVLNRHIATFLQEHLVVVNPSVNLLRIAELLLRHHEVPEPYHVVAHRDRSRSADFSRADVAALRGRRAANSRKALEHPPSISPEAWLAQVRQIEPWVRRIQKRGGQVVFVRFPTTGVFLQAQEHGFPRRECWDRLAAATGAVTIHFQDVPGMSGFDCPELSHLDYRDAPRFTQALLDELVRRGMLRRRHR